MVDDSGASNPFGFTQVQGTCTPESVPNTTTILLDTYNFDRLLPEPWDSFNMDGNGTMVKWLSPVLHTVDLCAVLGCEGVYCSDCIVGIEK